MTSYKPRPVNEVTTEDLIATIAHDRDCLATFEARHAYTARTRSDWRDFAPPKPRTFVSTDGGPVFWHDFAETGML